MKEVIAHFPRSTARSSGATCAGPPQGPPAGAREADRPVEGGVQFSEAPPLLLRPREHRLDMADVVAVSTATGSRSATTAASCSTASRWSTWRARSSASAASAPGAGSRSWRARPPDGDRLVFQVKEAQPSVLAPLRRRVEVRAPGPARGRRPAPHAGGERPLPRLGRRAALRPPVLHPPALGRQGLRAIRW